jgi:rRNA-processing protein FCF1
MDNIIVDTSSIIFGFSKGIDVFNSVEEQLGYKPVISKGILREIGLLAKRYSKYRKYAKSAEAAIKMHNPTTDPNSGFVDNWIISAAAKYGNVCTNDYKLKIRLKSMKINTYSISIGGKLR